MVFLMNKCFLIPLCLLASTNIYADETQPIDCSHLSGQWTATNSSSLIMYVTDPQPGSCGTDCTTLTMSYSLTPDVEHTSKIYCHEGQAGVSNKGPMVFSFEGAQGGHSIGTFNRQLNLLWAGVLPKDKNRNWIPQMDSYWFEKTNG